MPIIFAAAAAAPTPGGANLFTSPPPNPRINDPLPKTLPQPLPVPKRTRTPQPYPSPPKRPPNPALTSTHSRTRYYKPVPRSGRVLSSDGDRSVVVGDSGVSYLLPGAPFEFQFSYSETPKVKPLAIREPAFLPFAPPTMPRPWTGKAPLLSKKDKERKRKVRLFEPLGHPPPEEGEARVLEMAAPPEQFGRYPKDGRSREEILGEPLKRAEVQALVRPHLSHNRQVNLGRDGLTHNMLELIHTHWRRDEVCKVRCRGVPTVDMDNVCHHLEEKTGGKIIHRLGGVIYLFRGRNYRPGLRPRYPVMLWKPATPVYPKLIQEAPEGLTKLEADELRKKGKNLLPICKLAKNGIYINLVKDVRDAFEGSHLVKINCEGMHASDYKKLGAKLKELVPCVLLSFDREQILIWRGKDWRSRYLSSTLSVTELYPADSALSSDLDTSGKLNGKNDASPTKKTASTPKVVSLWKQAIDSQKALLLDETEITPDSLLERVEQFGGVSQASEHSYPAVILSGEGVDGVIQSGHGNDEAILSDRGRALGDFEDIEDDVDDALDVESTLPFGSLPVDSIIEGLTRE